MKRNQAGFSLIELMVVVAIIGVLATIAIPQVNRFIAKSRSSEAQVNLGALYTFNKNFYVEYQGYTNLFPVMGYVPEGRMRYNTGWSAAADYCPTAFTTVRGAGACAGDKNTAAACAATGASCSFVLGPGTATTAEAITGDTVSDAGFVAVSIANLVSSADADRWTITETKVITNTNDGTDGI